MWKYFYNPIAEFWKGVSLRFPSCTYIKFRNIHRHRVCWNTLHQLGYPVCLANFEQAVFLSKVISMKVSLNPLPTSLEVKCSFKNSPVIFSWRLSNQYSGLNINLSSFFILLDLIQDLITYYQIFSVTAVPSKFCIVMSIFCHLNFKNIIILSKLV